MKIGYAYPLIYGEPASFSQSLNRAFGRASRSGATIGARRGSQDFKFWKTWQVTLRAATPHAANLGGWSLSVHHAYDVMNGVFYGRDGTQRSVSVKSVGASIETVAGNGLAGFSGDGGPATQAKLYYPRGMALATDGSLYFADIENSRIRRVGPDGVITTVAGNGQYGFSGDGGLATQAHEQRYPYLLAQGLKPCGERWGKGKRLARTSEGIDGRAWPVRG